MFVVTEGKWLIIVKLKGGLGNQMFQYALGKSLALYYDKPLKIDADYIKNNEGYVPRDFSLSKFNIELDLYQEADKERVGFILKNNFLAKKLRNYFLKKGKYKGKYIIENPDNIGLFKKELFENHNESMYIDGYWQSYLYFNDIKECLIKEFNLKPEHTKEMMGITQRINETNSIAVHIRRGDYVNLGWTLDTTYYKKAIEEIVENVENPEFYVFSDDTDWVKNNLQELDNATFIGEYNLFDYQELWLMSKCKHNIISNSTFSWWGAWLNQNDHQVVVSPSTWINGMSLETTSLIPDSWKRI